MSTTHRWFRSGGYLLAAHIDSPANGVAAAGVVLVPPFGWEDLCSYRPLRFLGQMFAAAGFPTFRFDLPATGDSTGSPEDAALVAAWIQSISDAAAELRLATGVHDVCVMGVNLGATLAVSAATQGGDFQGLVLWGGAVGGRATLREMRAFRNLELPDFATSREPDPEGLEILGFLLNKETEGDLDNLDLTTLRGIRARPVLVLSRDDLPPDRRLVLALQTAGCIVEQMPGQGYAAMMALPHDVIDPVETGRGILRFFTKTFPDSTAVPAVCPGATPEEQASGVRETFYTASPTSSPAFGILSEPALHMPSAGWGIIFLNAGAVRHIGPNRMWVEAARRWALRGIPSLRLDFQGIGESDGELNLDVAGLYQNRLVEQVETAMALLRSGGIRRFAAIGLCSGAFWAFHAVLRNPDMRGAILLNPRLFFWDPEVDRRRLLRRSVRGLTDPAEWLRLARGELRPGSLKRIAKSALAEFRHTPGEGRQQYQIDPAAMAQARDVLEKNRSQLALIFTEGEPLLREMELEGQLAFAGNSSRIRCHRLSDCGHTFRPLRAQKSAHALIDCELDKIMQAAE